MSLVKCKNCKYDYTWDGNLIIRLMQTPRSLIVMDPYMVKSSLETGRDLVKSWGPRIPPHSLEARIVFAGSYFNNVVVDISGVDYRGYVDISDAGKRLFEGFYQAMLEDKWREKFSARLL